MVTGCVDAIDARIDDHGVVKANHPKAEELLEFIVAIDGDNPPMRRAPSVARSYVGVIEPGELSWYSEGVLPKAGDVESPSTYVVSASMDTIERADNAVVVKYAIPPDGPPETSFYHLQWCEDRQTWQIRRLGADKDAWDMPEDRPAFEWKTPEQKSAMEQAADTPVPKNAKPKDRKQWVWRDGGWQEAYSDPKAPAETQRHVPDCAVFTILPDLQHSDVTVVQGKTDVVDIPGNGSIHTFAAGLCLDYTNAVTWAAPDWNPQLQRLSIVGMSDTCSITVQLMLESEIASGYLVAFSFDSGESTPFFQCNARGSVSFPIPPGNYVVQTVSVAPPPSPKPTPPTDLLRFSECKTSPRSIELDPNGEASQTLQVLLRK